MVLGIGLEKSGDSGRLLAESKIIGEVNLKDSAAIPFDLFACRRISMFSRNPIGIIEILDRTKKMVSAVLKCVNDLLKTLQVGHQAQVPSGRTAFLRLWSRRGPCRF